MYSTSQTFEALFINKLTNMEPCWIFQKVSNFNISLIISLNKNIPLSFVYKLRKVRLMRGYKVFDTR